MNELIKEALTILLQELEVKRITITLERDSKASKEKIIVINDD